MQQQMMDFREKRLRNVFNFNSVRTESELAYNIVSPLTNIQLAIEMLESEDMPVDCTLFIEVVKRNCQRINELINEHRPV